MPPPYELSRQNPCRPVGGVGSAARFRAWCACEIIRGMSFVLTRDVGEFATQVEPLLMRLECNVMATVLINLRQGVFRDSPLFAYRRGESGRSGAAAMRVPRYPLLTSPLSLEHARELMEVWLTADPDLGGVVGVPTSAAAVAQEWGRLTGGRTRIKMRQAMHELRVVQDPPRRVSGRIRRASKHDRTVLIEWMRSFAAEAGVVGGGDEEAQVDARISMGSFLVWDDHGPVSMLAVHPRVAGVVRIGPVYTPPQFRRRGYAGGAVAAACRQALSDGAERCMLFTDLANPTSNKIYAEVGFRRVADWEEHAFERTSP